MNCIIIYTIVLILGMFDMRAQEIADCKNYENIEIINLNFLDKAVEAH